MMIITKTPLRISFAGGGTDFPDYYEEHLGAVISTTIDKFIYVMVKKRFDDKIVAHYRGFEIVDRPDKLKHELIREALKLTGIDKGIEISTTADIPSTGTGLGSSSALTVGVLHALHLYKGELPSKLQLAREACNIEIKILLNPIGMQDQFAVAYGGLNLITFPYKDPSSIQTLKLDNGIKKELNDNLMLFYTGIARKSEKILKEQRDNMRDKIYFLDKIFSLVIKLKGALEAGRIDLMGEILNENWMFKKELASGISTPEIEDMYELALQAGALGGKITGAGGGGFLLLYCPYEKQDKVREALKELRELPFSFTEFGTRVIFNIGG